MSKKEALQDKVGYTHEHLFLSFLIIVSAYAFLRSLQWPESTAVWPKYLSAYIFLGSALLLFKNHAPTWMQSFLQEGQVAATGGSKDDEDSDLVTDVNMENGETKTRESIPDHLATAIAILGYAIVSYLIGMFWATPIFVLAYCLWFKITPLKTAALIILGLSVAYTFESILNLPIMGGVLHV